MPVSQTRDAYPEDDKIAEKDFVVACKEAVSQFIDKVVAQSCRGAGANLHEPECSRNQRDSQVATH